jgi:alkylation response protein AidB-like acyl-CoA dehydrogenase
MVDNRLSTHAKFSSMAKAYCGENAFWIANTALQIMGGYGYMREYPIEKIVRDARILSIYEGTTEIQKNAIFKDIIKEAKFKNR